jgi:ankyrin repeat protein
MIMRKSILKKVSWCLVVCSLSFFGGCFGVRPIHKAAYEGDFKKVREIIEKDPSQINIQDGSGWTPLHLASGKGHIEIVEFLLNHGADTELENIHGQRPLCLAAKFGRYETIKTLLEHGAAVNHKDKHGGTPLHDAAMWSGEKVINLLISYGADVNARDQYQSTPLHQAAMLSNIEAAKALVEHGADIFAKNYYDYRKSPAEGRYHPYLGHTMNKTAKEIALKAGHIELAQYLQTKEEEKVTK